MNKDAERGSRLRAILPYIAASGAVAAAYASIEAILFRRLFLPSFGQAPALTIPDDAKDHIVKFNFRTQDNVSSSGHMFLHQQTVKTVVITHGHKGCEADVFDLAYELWKLGLNTVTYNLRGGPGGPKKLVTMGIKETNELSSVVYETKQRIPDASIGLLGISMGAVVSIRYAASDPNIKCLVLDSPYYSLTLLLNHHIKDTLKIPGNIFPPSLDALFTRITGNGFKELEMSQYLPRVYPRPILVIHGKEDKTTPFWHSELIYAHYKGPSELWIVPDVEHAESYVNQKQKYLDKVHAFFERHL
jgi:alpha-beta hydrolase superfamily lysophospholipase